MDLGDVADLSAAWAKAPPEHLQLARIANRLGIEPPEAPARGPRRAQPAAEIEAMVSAANAKPGVIGG